MTYDERIKAAASVPELTTIVHEISQSHTGSLAECKRLGGLVADRALVLVTKEG